MEKQFTPPINIFISNAVFCMHKVKVNCWNEEEMVAKVGFMASHTTIQI
jgi:hypothetical protein